MKFLNGKIELFAPETTVLFVARSGEGLDAMAEGRGDFKDSPHYQMAARIIRKKCKDAGVDIDDLCYSVALQDQMGRL